MIHTQAAIKAPSNRARVDTFVNITLTWSRRFLRDQ